MENKWSWEQKTLISELIQGMELAKKFKVDLQTSSSAETKDFMLQKILSSYEKALMILRWNGSMGQSQAARETPGLLPEYPISVNGSPLREDFDRGLMDHQDLRDGSKKRKMMPRWTDHVKVSSETGVEGAHDDGYNWRKYGQKDILGAKYPRSYYRCTFRNTQNCWATKQVQRSDEDPSIFNITYRGKHTCAHGNNIVPPPAVPEQQDKKQHNHNSDVYHGQPSQQTLTTFRNSLIINKNLDNAEIPYPFTFPSTSFGLKTNENHNLPPLAFENKTLLGSVSQSVLPPSTPRLHGNRARQLSPLRVFHLDQGPVQDAIAILLEVATAITSNSLPSCQCLVPMQQNKPVHLFLQAKPTLPQEAIVDEPDQIPIPVGDYH